MVKHLEKTCSYIRHLRSEILPGLHVSTQNWNDRYGIGGFKSELRNAVVHLFRRKSRIVASSSGMEDVPGAIPIKPTKSAGRNSSQDLISFILKIDNKQRIAALLDSPVQELVGN
jgi:hypothetical protein